MIKPESSNCPIRVFVFSHFKGMCELEKVLQEFPHKVQLDIGEVKMNKIETSEQKATKKVMETNLKLFCDEKVLKPKVANLFISLCKKYKIKFVERLKYKPPRFIFEFCPENPCKNNPLHKPPGTVGLCLRSMNKNHRFGEVIVQKYCYNLMELVSELALYNFLHPDEPDFKFCPKERKENDLVVDLIENDLIDRFQVKKFGLVETDDSRLIHFMKWIYLVARARDIPITVSFHNQMMKECHDFVIPGLDKKNWEISVYEKCKEQIIYETLKCPTLSLKNYKPANQCVKTSEIVSSLGKDLISIWNRDFKNCNLIKQFKLQNIIFARWKWVYKCAGKVVDECVEDESIDDPIEVCPKVIWSGCRNATFIDANLKYWPTDLNGDCVEIFKVSFIEKKEKPTFLRNKLRLIHKQLRKSGKFKD
jgi:hypothetical protein